MRKIIITIVAAFSFLSASAQWKAYLSYSEPTEIEQAGDGTIYVLASGGLYSYNPNDQQLQTYDKTTVLSDCGIEHIEWSQTTKKLLIIYKNNNIDLLSQNSNVENLPAYMNYTTTDDKTVNRVDVAGRYAYLSTNFGVVSLDLSRGEFANTYRLGFAVNYTYSRDGFLYAASRSNGVYRGRLTDNLVDKSKWTRVGEYVENNKTISPELLALTRTLRPGGPKYNYFGQMIFRYGNLYTVSGGYSPSSEMGYPGTVQVLRGNKEWQIYQDSLQSITGHSYVDNLCIDVDPRDTSHVMVGGRTGLYEFKSGQYVREYNTHNSPLESPVSSKDYVLIEGIVYDNSGKLWILNSAAKEHSLLELDTDGQMISHHSSAFVSPENNLSLYSMVSPIIDSRNILWFGNQHWFTPGLYYYNINNSDAGGFTTFTNEDGTSYVPTVHAIAEDRDNNLWIGLNIGPFMLETSEMGKATPTFTQVKVPRNDGTDLADYLLSNVNITSIVVDKANRKWFGTESGLYVIDSDNISQLRHFTAENSPLLSNSVISLALDESSGEMFIATSEGLCSYTSLIPDGRGMTKDNVYAYPNPVRPGYSGAITITGLEENASVKIVTSNGALVNEGIASGGEYRWYGLDRGGKQVASGVYMVEVATAEGDKGVVCKIAIVR